jgi:hypothetical protein
MMNTDQFILSVISLAYTLKKLVESNSYDESKHKLIHEFTRLNNRVKLLTKILEQKQTVEKFQEQQKVHF